MIRVDSISRVNYLKCSRYYLDTGASNRIAQALHSSQMHGIKQSVASVSAFGAYEFVLRDSQRD